MKSLPTDFKILNAIYERYYDTFASYSEEQRTRGTKIYVPIDIEALARDLDVDLDIVFGRLYYDLEKRYGYKGEDGTHTPFFTLRAGGDRHCVNSPYLASVLASLRDENRKYRLATSMAVTSFVISVVSFVLSVTG